MSCQQSPQGGGAHRVGTVLDGLYEHGGLRPHLHRPPLGRRDLRMRRQLVPTHCAAQDMLKMCLHLGQIMKR